MFSELVSEIYSTLGSVNDSDVKILAKLLKRSEIIFTCGNGGSSATASHFTQDLIKVAGIKSICCTDNVGFTTATSNDIAYERIFSDYLEVMGENYNCVLLISVSGNSRNLIDLAEYIRNCDKTIYIFGLLGNNGGELDKYCDFSIKVSSNDPKVVEPIHDVILHYIANKINYL